MKDDTITRLAALLGLPLLILLIAPPHIYEGLYHAAQSGGVCDSTGHSLGRGFFDTCAVLAAVGAGVAVVADLVYAVVLRRAAAIAAASAAGVALLADLAVWVGSPSVC